jgi:hypothetical protein
MGRAVVRPLLVVLLFVLSASRRFAGTSLVVTVVEEASRRALPNAEVIDLDSGVRWWTNDRGEAHVPWPSTNRLRLRARQLGFKPVERTLERNLDDSTADTLRIALERVAFELPQVVTREARRCGDTSDSLAKFRSLPALEQLRVGAERYGAFRKAYPFRVKQERRSVTVTVDGKPRSVRQATEEVNSDDWGDPYVPKETVRHEPLGFSIPILFVATLADSLFWARHCFSAPGIQSLDGERVVRLEFAPANGIEGPEWQGVAFIDSSTSLLRRVEFSLAGLPENDRPRRFEGYTTFNSPSPYIAIPDSTVAMWWRDGPRALSEWGMPDVVQLIRVLQIRYRKATPP